MDVFSAGWILLMLLAVTTALFLCTMESGAGTILGVAIPLSEHRSAETLALLCAYRRKIWQIAGLFALLGIPVLLTGRWFFAQFPLLMLWELAHLWACWRCQERCAGKLRTLRREKGWPVPDPNQIAVDTSVSRLREKMAVSPLWMLPGTLLAMIAAACCLFDGDSATLPLLLPVLLTQAVCWAVRYACRKGRATAYSDNPDVNRACHYASIRGWTGYAALLSAVSALSVLLLWLNSAGLLEGAGWAGFAAGLLIAVSLVGALIVMRKIRSRQQRILGQDVRPIPTETTSSHYRWGFYCNPADPRIVVPKRVGMGFTFNTGRLAGKWLMGGTLALTALLLAGVFGSLIWMGTADYVLTIGTDSVSISAPFYGEEFPLSELEGVSLAESIPGGSRTNGAAFGSTLLGHFRLDGVGNAMLYLRTDRMPCLVLDFGDVTVYYTAGSPEETARLAEQLSALLP